MPADFISSFLLLFQHAEHKTAKKYSKKRQTLSVLEDEWNQYVLIHTYFA